MPIRPTFSNGCRWSAVLVVMWAVTSLRPSAAANEYVLADPELKVVTIDSDPKESFWGVQGDGEGRLFVGGREALFVYEPDPAGLYRPRTLLYRFPAHSWVSDVAIRGHDLYALTHNALYLLEGAVVKREGVTAKRILWGLPPLRVFETHQGFHGLAFGRDGDLYVAFGDNLIGYGDAKRRDHWGHWTFFHGNNKTPYTGSGGVIRISPDGNVLTSVARGLRNPCGLAFDADWNLFTPENDHEGQFKDYPGRLLHVTPHAEFLWPRGWMRELTPWRADLLETMNADLGRYVPAGLAYYNDTSLPEKFRGCLVVAEWGKAALMRYALHPSGASFKADEFTMLTGKEGARPVGVGIGRGGRIFVTTLVMAGNDASPIAASDLLMITRADDPSGAPFTGWDPVAASDDELTSESADPSWSRRYRAHVELTRRGRIARVPPPDLATLEKSLADQDPRVVLAAIGALIDHRHDSLPLDAVVAVARGKDSYLQQTATRLLAEQATFDQLQRLSESTDAADRLAAVVALGTRLTVPPATEPLPASTPKTASGFAPEAHYDGEKVRLDTLGPLATFTMAEVWKHGKESISDGEAIFGLLQRRLHDADEQVAKQAAFFLRLLADPRSDADAAAILGIPGESIVKPIAGAVASTATELPAEYLGVDWAAEAAAGNADSGAKLYADRGCVKCHAIRPTDAVGAAPNLADAGKRFAPHYLAESILAPSKTVAPAFHATVLEMDDGRSFTGLAVGETEATLELLSIDGTTRTIDKKTIAARQTQNISPMPNGLIRDRQELRDLLAFLMR